MFRPFRFRELPLSGHLIVLFCLLVNVYAGWHFYAPLLVRGWGDFDDHTWRRDAERRNNLSTIFDPFLTTGHEAMDTSYVPVQSYIYHLSINVIDQGAMPIRVLGIWVHIFNSLLVLVLAFRFTGSVPTSHLASLAFLIYPRNGTTVAWLCASLAHGFVFLLYLAAFLLMMTYLHRRGWWRMALALLLFVTALLTKELSATLAAAILLYDVVVARGPRSLWPKQGKLRAWLGYVGRHGPFFAAVLGAVIVQKLKYETGFVNTKFGGMEFGARNPLRLLELATLFVHWGPMWSREQVLWAMAAIYGLVMAGLWLARRDRPMLFLILWAPLILTPFTISNFREVHTLGRYLYEVSFVIFIITAWLGLRLIRWKPVLQWPTVCAAMAFLAIFATSLSRLIGE